MSKIYTSVEQLIGGTPLLELTHIEKEDALSARLLVKLEAFNPGGSAKDRVGLAMIDEAEAAGTLRPGSVIIEPTSGNTGIGLAAIAAAKGYRIILTMPETMSVERRNELAAEIPGSVIPGQFVNPANPKAHFDSTGPEIWADTDGNVDFFVAGVGTGGTITGTGEYLKSRNPEVQVVAVEPAGSPVLSGGSAGPHNLQGIGAGFIPEVLDPAIIDELIPVREEDAYEAGRRLGRREGILTGISGGAALWAGLTLARRPENAGKTVVVLLPDTGDRYLSTAMFAE